MKLEFESNATSLPFVNQPNVDEMISDSNSPEVTKLLRDGIEAAQNGDRAEARTLLLRVTEADAKNENAWLWLASISEYPEELLVFLKNVLNINPNNERAIEWTKATESLMAKTFVQRGIDAAKNEQKDAAKQCFLQAIVHDGRSELAWLWLASVSNSPEEKMSHLQKVLSINPHNENAISSLKSAKHQMAKALMPKANQAALEGKREEAQKLLDEIVNDASDFEDAWMLKAHLAESLEDKIGYFEQVLEVNSENQVAKANLDSLKMFVDQAKDVEVLEDVAAIDDIEMSYSEPEPIVEETFKEEFSNEDSLKSPNLEEASEVDSPQLEEVAKTEVEMVELEVEDFNPEAFETEENAKQEYSEVAEENAKQEYSEVPEENAKQEYSEVAEENAKQEYSEVAEENAKQEYSEVAEEQKVYTEPVQEFEAEDIQKFGSADVPVDVVEEFPSDDEEVQVQNVESNLEETVSMELDSEVLELEVNPKESEVEHADEKEVQFNEEKSIPTQLEYQPQLEQVEKPNDAEPIVANQQIVEQVDQNLDKTEVSHSVATQEEITSTVIEPTEEPIQVTEEPVQVADVEEIVVDKPIVDKPLVEETVVKQKTVEVEDKFVACGFCESENETKAFLCKSCKSVLTLSDLEMLLSQEYADKEAVQNTLDKLEADKESVGVSNKELKLLGIGYINLKEYRKGYEYLKEASQNEPNDVMLSSQIDALAIRIDEIEKQAINLEAQPKSKTILVVDDSPTVRKLISGKLEKCGHNAICAVDGMDALAKINEVVPDLILLDITMPRMDGYQVCKLIRGNEATEEVPVVMISGKDGFFDKVRGRMAGTDNYITKPFGPETLMMTVNQYISE